MGNGNGKHYVPADQRADVDERCTGLTALNVPASVTSIGNLAFKGCTSMTSLTFSAGLTTIGTGAFSDCTGLTSVAIPASVTSIGGYVFDECSNLGTVTLNSNPYIGWYAFKNMKADATVTMNLTGNEGATGEYWMTFYNLDYNFQVPATTRIFKAWLSGTTLALTELTTDSGNDFSHNALEGVSYPGGKAGDGSTYVLNKKAGTGVGFYKLADGKKVGVGKAYLTTSASAPEFLAFDETTNIKTTNFTDCTDSKEWYNLNGQRVANPTKGLYIVNGKKVIIK